MITRQMKNTKLLEMEKQPVFLKNLLEVKNNQDKTLNYVEGVESENTPIRIANTAKKQSAESVVR